MLKCLCMAPAAKDNRTLLVLSTVGWFFPLPELRYIAGSVAPEVCPLVLAAARALPTAMHRDARNDRTLATTQDGPGVVETAGPWPRCDEQGLPRASRIVRFTRSIKAVFNRPERPRPNKATLRAASVPRRITCETPTNFRQRSTFFHLAVNQARRYLPLTCFPSSSPHFEPLSKMGWEAHRSTY
jgi:hypothetical protein